MPEFGLTATGFYKKRLDDLVTQIENEFKSVYGANFKVSPETQQGQVIANIAAEYASLWDLAEDVYNAFNPSAARNKALSDLVQYNNITRSEATYSQVSLTLSGTSGAIIPGGVFVETETGGARFQTLEAATLVNGTAVVPARAIAVGPVEAAENTITVIISETAGWTGVTNSAAAVPGREEETDEQLISRRNRSTALNGRTILDAISAQLEAVENVIRARVLENDTEVNPDANGVPAHHIEAIVQGGAAEDIRGVLLHNKVPGIPYAGTVSIPATDSQGTPVTIRYTPPEAKPIRVILDLTIGAGYPADGDDQIRDNIIAYAQGQLVNGRGFSVGDDVILSELYTPINAVPGHSVNSLQIGTLSRVGTDNVPIGVRDIATFNASRIIIAR